MGNGALFQNNHNDVKESTQFTESELVKNAILCCKSAALNVLVYHNSVRDKGCLLYEEENVKFLKISDYKIWTYADYAEQVLDALFSKPAVSAQCTTGIISRLSDDFPNPIPFICFGGTISLYEVIEDLSSVIHGTGRSLKGNIIGTSGMGMLDLYYTLRSFGLIDFIINKMKEFNSGLLVTGHSIGGAVSVLFTSELLIDYPELFDTNPIHLITFGSPRVFTPSSAATIHELMKAKPNFKFIRIVNRRDIISMLPSSSSRSLVHIGTAYYLGKQAIEIFSGDVHVNFPQDKEGMFERMIHFVNSKGVFHRMDPALYGYLPRLVSLCFNQVKTNVGEMKDLSALLQSLEDQKRFRFFRSTDSFKRNNKAAVTKQVGLVDCKIWTDISHPQFCYPEALLEAMTAKKKSFGIALGGGGLSAACFALGWLRALHLLGALKSAGYISSVGSSSWVHVPMSYGPKQTPLDEFLGPYVPPGSCTPEAANKSVSRGHGKVLAEGDVLKDTVVEHVHLFAHFYHHSNSWSETVGKKFLKPHGFKMNSSGVPSLDGEAKERLKTLTSGWVNDLYTSRPLKEHPYPIVNGALFVGSSRGCLPVEFTPMYYGIIPYYEDASIGVGGCLIEPHGFTSKPDPMQLRLQMAESSSTKSNDFCTLLKVPKPDFTVNLHEIAGISSSNAFTTHNYSVLPTFTPLRQGDNIASREHFQDGNCCDSTGIIALLRRKCTSIIACITSTSRLEDSESIADANQHSLGHLAGLFGRQVSDKRVFLVKSESYNEQRKVFPSEAWDELLGALISKCNG